MSEYTTSSTYPRLALLASQKPIATRRQWRSTRGRSRTPLVEKLLVINCSIGRGQDATRRPREDHVRIERDQFGGGARPLATLTPFRETDCVAGHVRFEPRNPSASYLIAIS
jgi:hypothetical protein